MDACVWKKRVGLCVAPFSSLLSTVLTRRTGSWPELWGWSRTRYNTERRHVCMSVHESDMWQKSKAIEKKKNYFHCIKWENISLRKQGPHLIITKEGPPTETLSEREINVRMATNEVIEFLSSIALFQAFCLLHSPEGKTHLWPSVVLYLSPP